MSKKEKINTDKIPRHVAVIMDGNGRWAQSKGLPRVLGHRNGVKAVRNTTEIAAELGVKYLTLYAFSTENWSRPKYEVNALMTLLIETTKKELKTLMKNDIKLDLIGDISKLPSKSRKAIEATVEKTRDNKRMTLILALNYSARWEIMQAAQAFARDVAKDNLELADLNETVFSSYLCTHNFPDPELMIRTSGEQRISNFLLWQLAYTELYFTQIPWPDFGKEDFIDAIIDFQSRERRFGKTSEQIESK